METSVLTPRSLFQKAVCYVIPEFQRSYVWDGDGRWGPLWEDVQNTADRYLEHLDQHNGDKAKAERQTNPHFLGAVVVKQERTATEEIEQRTVVDGQQRITTLQLLLAAVKGVCQEEKKPTASKRLLKLVKNDEDIYSGDNLYKLCPSIEDKTPFQQAIDAVSDADSRDAPLVVQAYDYFRRQAAVWVQDGGPDEVGRRVEALEAAVTSLVHMVVIDLGEPDDPHVIFETLNARGTPLLASDLVKNYVLSRLGEDVQAGIWSDLEDSWWREEVQQGRLRRAQIEVALHYWLTMRKAEEVSSSRIFREFKEYADSKTAVIEVVHDVKSVLGKYRDFQTRNDLNPDNKRFRDRMQVMQMGVVTPVLLRLLDSYDQSDQRFVRALYALESFMVRRMVCRMTTKDYNSMMQSLLRALNGASAADSVVVNFLKEQKADARIWPNDGMIKETFRGLDIYRLLTRGRLRLVLEGIEEELREGSDMEGAPVRANLTIEHVMPQAWPTNWPLPVSSEDIEDARHRRNRAIHNHRQPNLDQLPPERKVVQRAVGVEKADSPRAQRLVPQHPTDGPRDLGRTVHRRPRRASCRHVRQGVAGAGLVPLGEPNRRLGAL